MKIGNILLVVGNHVGHVCLIELISREFFELCFCSRILLARPFWQPDTLLQCQLMNLIIRFTVVLHHALAKLFHLRARGLLYCELS